MRTLTRVAVSLLLFGGVVSLVPTAAQSQEPSCQNPTLDFTQDQSVTLPTLIKWRPANCLMVVETWRSGQDCKKVGVTDSKGRSALESGPCAADDLRDVGVHSGAITIEQIRGDQKGPLQIKLWVPNAGIVTPVVRVNVQ